MINKHAMMRWIDRFNFGKIQEIINYGDIWQEGKKKYRAILPVKKKTAFVIFNNEIDYLEIKSMGITSGKGKWGMKMRCGNCNIEMEEKLDFVFGESVKVFKCPKCEKELVPLEEAVRVQKKILPKIHEKRKIVRIGHSSGITLPKKLESFFKQGDEVEIDFDPEDMELKVRKKKVEVSV